MPGEISARGLLLPSGSLPQRGTNLAEVAILVAFPKGGEIWVKPEEILELKGGFLSLGKKTFQEVLLECKILSENLNHRVEVIYGSANGIPWTAVINIILERTPEVFYLRCYCDGEKNPIYFRSDRIYRIADGTTGEIFDTEEGIISYILSLTRENKTT